ncbi:MAG: hypothetical protein ACPGU7_05090 [Gammaproteobacteria bacterium]
MSCLHITNGDCAAGVLRAAGVEGDILPWRDVLHDGPVPAGLDLEALSRRRAGFIVGRGWGDAALVQGGFERRDACFLSLAGRDRVVLWFEHDLYDQLQLLQILDGLDAVPGSLPPISLICTDRYLGMLEPADVNGLWDDEQAVNEPMRALARRSWAAFRAETPVAWASLLAEDTSALPFLEGAIQRQLEEYPWCRDGLSRTARRALRLIAGGERRPGSLFAASQAREERVFMGDLSFWSVLEELAHGPKPLIAIGGDGSLAGEDLRRPVLALTTEGEAVLAGRISALDCLAPDRWIGGVRLCGGAPWCWNEDARSAVRGDRYFQE